MGYSSHLPYLNVVWSVVVCDWLKLSYCDLLRISYCYKRILLGFCFQWSLGSSLKARFQMWSQPQIKFNLTRDNFPKKKKLCMGSKCTRVVPFLQLSKKWNSTFTYDIDQKKTNKDLYRVLVTMHRKRYLNVDNGKEID